MTLEEKQTYAIIFLSLTTLVQQWLIWRTDRGCRVLARAIAALQERP